MMPPNYDAIRPQILAASARAAARWDDAVYEHYDPARAWRWLNARRRLWALHRDQERPQIIDPYGLFMKTGDAP